MRGAEVILVLHQVAHQLHGDADVLYTVRHHGLVEVGPLHAVHVLGPVLKTLGLEVVLVLALHFTEAVAPCFQRVGAIALARKNPTAQQATVGVLEVRVDQAGQDQGIQHALTGHVEALTGQLALDLVEGWDVVFDPVVEDQQTIRLRCFCFECLDVGQHVIGAVLNDLAREGVLGDSTVEP
ncbi:hypothetical protein CCNLGMII_00024 [Pseudomonas phage phi C106]|nr:hypothetical protein CCNLGMII_00024 [Pseudomonas phage phi C106]